MWWGCNLTLQVLVQDVLEAVEDRLVIFDLSALGGVGPLLAALEVGVHLTRVGGVLLVMCHLHTEEGEGGEGGTLKSLVSAHNRRQGWICMPW